jgi:putative peptidoglycan lipid II flippase
MSKSLFKSTSLVSAMTFISRILGFIRDMIAAQIFGATASVDAFYIAFKIPNFMRGLFAEGSFSQAFVPILSEYRETKEIADIKAFLRHMSAALGSVLLIITIIGVIAAPLIILIFAPGLDPLRFQLSTDMLRITFPYLMLISLTAFSGAVLNSYNVFGVPSFTPALLNVSLIATALWLAPYLHISVESQAWGVFLAGVIQLCFQLPFLYRLGFLSKPKFDWQDEGVRRVLLLMLPALFGASVGQISLLLNTVFASFLPIGSVTWLYYSDRLAYFPLGVFGVALATVVLPHLSRKHAAKSPQQFNSALDWGIRCNLLIGIPAAFVLWVLAGPIIVTLFQYGKFSQFDVIMTKESVIAYTLGLPAFMLVKVLSAGFFARLDVKTPVKIGIIAIVVNVILNAVLIIPFKHAGLALATSISAWFNVFMLWFVLRKQNAYRPEPGWFLYLFRLVFANAVVVLFLYFYADDLILWFARNWQDRFLHLTILLFSAMGIYLSCLGFAGLRLSHLRVQMN